MRFGDVEKGFAEADHILEQTYRSSPIEQAPTETTGCIVVPEGNDRFTCYTNTQAMFFTLDNTSIILQMPGHKLHFVGGTVGGGFGGKVDVTVEPIAILASKLTGRPVSFIYSREEEMQISSPRAAEKIVIKDGVIEGRPHRRPQGHGLYRRRRLFAPFALWRAEGRRRTIPAPTRCPMSAIDTYCVYTNRTPSSAMRGFGVTIADFALEVQMDKLARLIGMDPLEFRFINAYRDGDMKAHRQPTEGAALIECMQEASQRRRLAGRRALSCAMSSYGGRPEHGDPARTRRRRRQLSDRHESRRRPEPGAGAFDADRQLHGDAVLGRSRPGPEAGHGADLRRDDRRARPTRSSIDTADTDTGPHCMGTFASRGTHRIGNAVIQAATEARQVMLEVAAEELEVDAADLETDGAGQHPRQGRAAEVDLDLRHRACRRISSAAARSRAAACSWCRAPIRRPRPAR